MVNKKEKKTNIVWILMGAILTVYSLSLIFMVVWGIMISFKSPEEFNYSGVMFSSNLSFKSFDIAMNNLYVMVRINNRLVPVYFLEMFYNTFVYSAGSAFMQTTCTMIMAYATAKFRYKYSTFITVLVYTLMVLPVHASMAAGISVAKTVGTYDSMVGLFIMKFHFLGMYFLIYQTRFKAIPREFASYHCLLARV